MCLPMKEDSGTESASDDEPPVLLKPSTAANRGARLFSKQQKCRLLVNCICTHATGSHPPEHETCMTRRPPAAECRDETTCLRPNVPTGHKVSPDPTRQKARHSVQRIPQPTSADHSKHLNTPSGTTQPKATVAEQPRAHQSEHYGDHGGPRNDNSNASCT